MRLTKIFKIIDEEVFGDPELDTAIDNADSKIDSHTSAIHDFVGGPHDMMKRKPSDYTLMMGGIMYSKKLEDAYSPKPTEKALIDRQHIEQHFAPIKAALKTKYGKSIKLYRGQCEIRNDADHRNILSWTNNYEVSTGFVGAFPKVKKPITDEQIAQLYKTYQETGKVKFNRNVYVRTEPPVFDDPEYQEIWGNNPDYYEIYDRDGEMVTDGDDLVKSLKDDQEWEIEKYEEYKKKLENIKSAEVDIDAIVWITDRFGQQEFMVKNIPGTPWYISHLKESTEQHDLHVFHGSNYPEIKEFSFDNLRHRTGTPGTLSFTTSVNTAKIYGAYVYEVEVSGNFGDYRDKNDVERVFQWRLSEAKEHAKNYNRGQGYEYTAKDAARLRNEITSGYYAMWENCSLWKDLGWDGVWCFESGSSNLIVGRNAKIKLLKKISPVYENALQIQTPAFRKWFGNSKVVDAHGQPLRVYKGMRALDDDGKHIDTIARKSEFPAFNGTEKGFKITGFFTSTPDVAARFSGLDSIRWAERNPNHPSNVGNVHSSSTFPVYLKMERPFIIDAQGDKAGNVQFGATGKVFRDAVRSGKYDGVIIKNTADEADVYIALKSENIKSAIGNNGDFNINSPKLNEDMQNVQWKAPNFTDYRVVWVDVAKFDNAFKNDKGFYVGASGAGGIGNRYQNFGKWLEQGQAVEMPVAYLSPTRPDAITFGNGRHRYAWMRDHGAKSLPMMVPNDQSAQMAKLYGSNEHAPIGETI